MCSYLEDEEKEDALPVPDDGSFSFVTVLLSPPKSRRAGGFSFG